MPVELRCKEKTTASSSLIQIIVYLSGLLFVSVTLLYSLLPPDSNESKAGRRAEERRAACVGSVCLELKNSLTSLTGQSPPLTPTRPLINTLVPLTGPFSTPSAKRPPDSLERIERPPTPPCARLCVITSVCSAQWACRKAFKAALLFTRCLELPSVPAFARQSRLQRRGKCWDVAAGPFTPTICM